MDVLAQHRWTVTLLLLALSMLLIAAALAGVTR